MSEEVKTPSDFGPYLTAALICERVLLEQNGMPSVIRIIDRVTHSVAGRNTPETMEPFTYQISLFIAFKSGEALGVHRLSIEPIKPSNERVSALIYTVNFEGPSDHGINVVGDIKVVFDEVGLWWFDLWLSPPSSSATDRRRVTRIPFRVVYMPQTI